MNKYIIIMILSAALQTTSMQTAEESKSPEHWIQTRDEEITNYVNQYPHLKEGFDILRNIDANMPIFYDFLDAHIVSNDENQDSYLGEVIEHSEDIIADNMQNRFYNALKNEIDQLQQQSENSLTTNNSFDLFSSDGLIPISTRKTITNHHINGFSFNTTQDPIFQYVMHYKDRFMQPIIRNWIQNGNHYIKLLDQAITLNHLPLADFLLNMGIDPNSKLYGTISLLGSAVSYERAEIVALFLTAGARTDITIPGMNYGRETLLTEATLHNDIATSQLLVQYHADLNAYNSVGKNPLLIAIEKQNRELIHILLHAGANPNIPDILQDYTMLHFINAHSEIFNHTYNNDIANALPNFNIDATQRDVYGDTPLIVATHNNFIDIVQILIQADANLNTANIFYGTALQIAQRNNYTEIANILLQAGAVQYTPAERFWPKTTNLFLPPLSSQLENRNYFMTPHNALTQYQENTLPSSSETLFDFDELFPILQSSNYVENYIFDDLFDITALEDQVPAVQDQVPAIETLMIQDAIEIPAAPAEDQPQPKIKKRKRLQSSDESQVSEPDKALDFNNKRSK